MNKIDCGYRVLKILLNNRTVKLKVEVDTHDPGLCGTHCYWSDEDDVCSLFDINLEYDSCGNKNRPCRCLDCFEIFNENAIIAFSKKRFKKFVKILKEK